MYTNIRTGSAPSQLFLSGFLLLTLSIAIDGHAASQDLSMPDTMQIVREGDVGVMVPKGGKVRKESSFMVKEDPEDYASRRFSESDGRFERIEKEIAAMKEEIESLKTAVATAGAESESPAASAEPAEIQVAD